MTDPGVSPEQPSAHLISDAVTQRGVHILPSVTRPSEVKFAGTWQSFVSVSHSEEQDSVPDQRLHHDAEDSPDVAVQEEAQAEVGVLSFFLLPSLSLLLLLHPFLPPVLHLLLRRPVSLPI